MAAIHASVIMQFVDDDVLQILEGLRPLGMVRQDAGMHHVWIREDHIRALADRAARVLRCIAVVRERLDFRPHAVRCGLEFM